MKTTQKILLGISTLFFTVTAPCRIGASGLEVEKAMLENIVESTYKTQVVLTLEDFLTDLGNRESSGRYGVVNSLGYMGKYQFGMSTLRGLGYKVSREEFINSPELQEKAMLSLLKHNKHILRNYTPFYEGDTLYDVPISESGLLAAAHLAGPGRVKRFLNYGVDFEDAYGTKMTDYMKKFSGYNLDI